MFLFGGHTLPHLGRRHDAARQRHALRRFEWRDDSCLLLLLLLGARLGEWLGRLSRPCTYTPSYSQRQHITGSSDAGCLRAMPHLGRLHILPSPPKYPSGRLCVSASCDGGSAASNLPQNGGHSYFLSVGGSRGCNVLLNPTASTGPRPLYPIKVLTAPGLLLNIGSDPGPVRGRGSAANRDGIRPSKVSKFDPPRQRDVLAPRRLLQRLSALPMQREVEDVATRWARCNGRQAMRQRAGPAQCRAMPRAV